MFVEAASSFLSSWNILIIYLTGCTPRGSLCLRACSVESVLLREQNLFTLTTGLFKQPKTASFFGCQPFLSIKNQYCFAVQLILAYLTHFVLLNAIVSDLYKLYKAYTSMYN